MKNESKRLENGYRREYNFIGIVAFGLPAVILIAFVVYIILSW